MLLLRYEYPELVLDIECGGGTYVRSLGRDLAEAVGTAAIMSALVRTAIGPWTVAEAIDPRSLTAADWDAQIEPLVKAVVGLPKRELSPAEVSRVRQGLTIPDGGAESDSEVAAVDCRGRLVSLLVRRGPSEWGPSKNFA